MHRPRDQLSGPQCSRRRSSNCHSYSRSSRNYPHRSTSRSAKDFRSVLQDASKDSSRYQNNPKSVSRKSDFLFTNGNIFAVRIAPPQRTEFIKMERRNVPLKPDFPPEVFVSSSAPKVLYPRRSIWNQSTINLYKGTVGCSRTNSLASADNLSTQSEGSNLTSREEAVARKLNNLIQKMEADLPHTNGADGRIYGASTLPNRYANERQSRYSKYPYQC